MTVEDAFGLPGPGPAVHTITVTDWFVLENLTGKWNGLGKGGAICLDIISVALIDAHNINWNISVVGGIFGLINVSANGMIDTLEAGITVEVCTEDPIFGLGNIDISVSASKPGGDPRTKDAKALVIGPFIINIIDEETT